MYDTGRKASSLAQGPCYVEEKRELVFSAVLRSGRGREKDFKYMEKSTPVLFVDILTFLISSQGLQILKKLKFQFS